jgi:hypothetical protein
MYIYFQLHLHSSNMDWDKFNAEYIPKSCLPSDFGGDLESVAELQDKSCKDFQRAREYFILEEQQTSLKLDDLALDKQSLKNDFIFESERGVKSVAATID